MKRVLFFFTFAFYVFSALPVETLPFGNSTDPTQNVSIYPSPISQFGGYQGGTTYSPFGTSNQGNTLDGPILYGPGGEPIGGLPVNNGLGLMTLLTAGYLIYKTRKSTSKNHK